KRKKYMIEIREVLTKKDQKKFVQFPNKLYTGSKFFVPALNMDEMAIFGKKNASWEDCEMIYFLALDNDKVVGRIAGIIQKLSNKKTGEKKARFSRFDAINNLEVAKALFGAVENWAKSKGMEKVHGPLGFNDLDREGMLIEGFDEVCTYEEQYNYDYYPVLMEKCGYKKEIDWLEFKLYTPEKVSERLERVSKLVLKRYKLHLAVESSKRKYLKKYAKDIFRIIDEAYAPLHGTVPFNDKMRKSIIDQFNLFISADFIITVLNEKNEPIAFGFAIPSLSEPLIKCRGKLTPKSILNILKFVKKPKIVDLGLIGVIPEYQSKGVNSVVLREMQQRCIDKKIEYCETNLNLEDNTKVMQQWDEFEKFEQHKRRRCYIKMLG
ncbi:MAG: hypothetical protein WCR30_04970, partial [Clostridia bacterium]